MIKDHKKYIEYLKENTLEKTDIIEVTEELKRPDCFKGKDLILCLPSEDKIEKILSDKEQVRYFIYTEDWIYIVYIDCNHDYNFVDGKIKHYDDEDWELKILPR